MTDLTQTLGRLAAILGEPEGEPEPLDGGITNRNYKVYFGGVALRDPRARQGHHRCSESTARPSGPRRAPPRAPAWAPRYGRCSTIRRSS